MWLFVSILLGVAIGKTMEPIIFKNKELLPLVLLLSFILGAIVPIIIK